MRLCSLTSIRWIIRTDMSLQKCSAKGGNSISSMMAQFQNLHIQMVRGRITGHKLN